MSQFDTKLRTKRLEHTTLAIVGTFQTDVFHRCQEKVGTKGIQSKAEVVDEQISKLLSNAKLCIVCEANDTSKKKG